MMQHYWNLLTTCCSLLSPVYQSSLRLVDLLLQLQQPIQKRFCCWWATWHIHINRDNAVAASHDGVGIVIIASAVRAAPHRYYPSGLRHLVVNLAQRRSHFVRQCASHNHHIRLSRRGPEDDTEAIKIIACCMCAKIHAGYINSLPRIVCVVHVHWNHDALPYLHQRASSPPHSTLIRMSSAT
jgi:hypothetical protein